MHALAAVLLAAAAAKGPAAKKPAVEKTPPGARAVDCGPARCLLFESPEAALKEVLAERPSVLAVGEVHQIEGAPEVPSSIKRFTELLALMQDRTTDLVVETWITDGECGEVETKAVEEVQKEIERPPETANEVLALGIRAKELGIQPHILRLSCEEYEALLREDGSLNEERLLQLVAGKLSELALGLHRVRTQRAPRGFRPMVVVYGGALHNDAAPAPEDATYCFGPQVAKQTRERYLELDLYVPEYIEKDDDLAREPWFAAMDAEVRGTATLLATPRKGSRVLVFPWAAAARAAAAPGSAVDAGPADGGPARAAAPEGGSADGPDGGARDR